MDLDPETDAFESTHYGYTFSHSLPISWAYLGLRDRDDGRAGPNLIDRLKVRMDSQLLMGLMEWRLTEEDLRSLPVGYVHGPVRIVRRLRNTLGGILGYESPEFDLDSVYTRDTAFLPAQIYLPFELGVLLSDLEVSAYMDFQLDQEGWVAYSDRNPESPLDGTLTEAERAWDLTEPAWFSAHHTSGDSVISRATRGPGLESVAIDLIYLDGLPPDPPEKVPGNGPGVGFKISKLESVAAGTYDFVVQLTLIRDYQEGDPPRVFAMYDVEPRVATRDLLGTPPPPPDPPAPAARAPELPPAAARAPAPPPAPEPDPVPRPVVAPRPDRSPTMVPVVVVDPRTPDERARDSRAAGEMIRVPAGTVRYRPRLAGKDIRVEVDTVWIDRTEVTVRDYERCVRAGGCSADELTQSAWGDARTCNWGRADRTFHPVNCVDWEQARTYCAWTGKRLPTEPEWMRAALGSKARALPWGDDLPGGSRRVANLADRTLARESSSRLHVVHEDYDDGFASTAPVGSFREGASPFGVLDLVGNVAEFTATLPTPASALLRGGSWTDVVPSPIVSVPVSASPLSIRSSASGFRCVTGAP